MVGNTYGKGWAVCEGIWFLSSIAGSDSVTEEGLLFAEPFSVCVLAANVMLQISREA